MTRIQPRLTRRELQSLIRSHAWTRLARRLNSADPGDIAAQMPGLHPSQREVVARLLDSRRTSA
ncbi:MAG: hypothetical protein ACXIUL_06750 [Wenzhouxiangella sp.]